MTVSEMFSEFADNLKINTDLRGKISDRYERLTAVLNKNYYDDDSKTKHSLQVGSYGRKTASSTISDLDMIFILPDAARSRIKTGEGNRASALLQEIRNVIYNTYPNTNVSGDGQVVVVSFTDNCVVEIVPAFELADNSFEHPDSNDGGRWKITNPRPEIGAIAASNTKTNENMRRIAQMARAWRDKMGVSMGGLLVDTLVYNFFESNTDHHTTTFSTYPDLLIDFFQYVSKVGDMDQQYLLAPGSGQRVKIKSRFVAKAKKARKICEDAKDSSDKKIAHTKWRKVFGKRFPAAPSANQGFSADSAGTMRNVRQTEEFIEDKYEISIKYELEIDCEVTQDGFQTHRLAEMLAHHFKLLPKRSLKFFIVRNSVPNDYDIYWKVTNRGDEAERRDIIRGQIVKDSGFGYKKESSNFRGDHEVECYIVKNGVVVARDHIDVPITES